MDLFIDTNLFDQEVQTNRYNRLLLLERYVELCIDTHRFPKMFREVPIDTYLFY